MFACVCVSVVNVPLGTHVGDEYVGMQKNQFLWSSLCVHAYVAEVNIITCAFVLLNIETLFRFYRTNLH